MTKEGWLTKAVGPKNKRRYYVLIQGVWRSRSRAAQIRRELALAARRAARAAQKETNR